MNFKHYFTNEELEFQLQEWAEAYPTLFTLSQIGSSYQEQPIWLVTLTNQATGVDIEKPAVWLDANIHATELAGTVTILHALHTLLTGYGQDERITRLLDTSTFYAMPRVNPDGAALAMAATPRYIRSGVRAYPWEEKAAGLHMEDVDGDGRILQIRIPDPHGDWKVSSLDTRLMEKREPDEQGGTYYRLLPEGLIDHFDGYTIKIASPLEGLDFNRNFPFEWRPEAEQPGAGPYPASETEIKAMVDFIAKHPNINAALTYHTHGGVILRSYSTKPDEEMDTDDLRVYQKLGDRGSQLTGYPCLSIYHDFRYHPKEVITGAFDDWLYDHFGIFAFTVELWDLPGQAGVPERKILEWFQDHPHADDLKILQWLDQQVGSEAYVEWYPFEHPQLGAVELGGWNTLYTWRNPPPNWLEREAERNTPFVLALGDMLPHLTIHTLDLKPLGQDVYQLKLVLENTGFWSTSTSQQGRTRQAARPVRVELSLPETAILASGRQRLELGHLEGRSNKLSSAYYSNSPTDNRAYAEWVLQALPGAVISVKVQSDRAGTLHNEVQVPLL